MPIDTTELKQRMLQGEKFLQTHDKSSGTKSKMTFFPPLLFTFFIPKDESNGAIRKQRTLQSLCDPFEARKAT